MKKQLAKIAKELEKEFSQWQHIKDSGCMDPFHEDRVNLNLVRNHIIYYKRQIKEICKETGLPLPEICDDDTPPEVDQSYMARADEIRTNAKKSLTLYKSDANFNKFKNVTGITDNKKAQLLTNVIGYMRGLEQAIEEDDLVTMRRHCYPKGYLKSAEDMVAKLTDEDFIGQMSLLSLL